MIDSLLPLLFKFWPLVLLVFLAGWAACFKGRRWRWILPVWAMITLPLALVTTRWLRVFGMDSSGPDGGWVAMEAGYAFLFLLPVALAFGAQLLVMPRRPAWNWPAIAAGLGVVVAECLLFQHWSLVPPTGRRVIFVVKNLDGTPIVGAAFSQVGSSGLMNSEPSRELVSGAEGIIETCTSAGGGM